MRPIVFLLLFGMLGQIPGWAADTVDCAERQWVDRLYSGDWRDEDFAWLISRAPLPPLMESAYRALAPLTALNPEASLDAVDLESARKRLRAVYDQWRALPEPGADELYAALIVSSTLARIELNQHHYLAAWRFGRIMLEIAEDFRARFPGDSRPVMFQQMHAYHSGRAPTVLRPLVHLLGMPSDSKAAVVAVEKFATESTALAPEAARVLLAEIKPRDRKPCRYLRLADDLVRTYPANQYFHWLRWRERNRCPYTSSQVNMELPGLAPSCPPAGPVTGLQGSKPSIN